MHWLRGTVHASRRLDLQEYLELWWGESEERDYGLWIYDRSTAWPNRVCLNWHSTMERAERLTAGGITLEVPGSAIEVMDPDLWFSFCRGLDQFLFVPTRIDVFFDDFDRLVTPRELYPMVYELDLLGEEFRREFKGFEVCEIKRKVGGRRPKSLGGKRGLNYDQLIFGHRGNAGSGKCLRFYDKYIETEGKRNCMRWELETSGRRAELLWEMMMNVPTEKMGSIIGAAIGGCIDFRHRLVRPDGSLAHAGDKNWTRCKRFKFWQRIIDQLGLLPLALPIHRKQIDQSWEWAKRTVIPSLQMIRAAWGPDTLVPKLLDLIGSEDRLTPAHRLAIEEYRRAVAGKPALDIADLRAFADQRDIPLEGEPQEPEYVEPAPMPPSRVSGVPFVMTGRHR